MKNNKTKKLQIVSNKPMKHVPLTKEVNVASRIAFEANDLRKRVISLSVKLDDLSNNDLLNVAGISEAAERAHDRLMMISDALLDYMIVQGWKLNDAKTEWLAPWQSGKKAIAR